MLLWNVTAAEECWERVLEEEEEEKKQERDRRKRHTNSRRATLAATYLYVCSGRTHSLL